MLKRVAFKPKNVPPFRQATQWTGSTMPSPRSAAVAIVDTRAHLVVPLEKAKPLRDKAYRMRVAALACINCGIHGHSQAAHGPTLGKGIKASDRELFPLCCVSGNDCHWKFDNYRLFNREGRALAGAMWAARTRLTLGVE